MNAVTWDAVTDALTAADHVVAEVLDAAALHCDPADGPPFFAALVADERHSAQDVHKLWDEFASALRELHRLLGGTDQAAVDQAAKAAAEARERLLNAESADDPACLASLLGRDGGQG